MASSVIEYINKCETCKKTKPYNQITTPPAGKYVPPGRPWRIVATDICGPYTMSRKGNRFLLVAIDIFSKFTIIKPVRSASAENVTKFIEEEVILKFACPEILLSDNGTQYKSLIFKNMLNARGVQSWYTAYYFAAANPTECVNKTIGNAIRAYIRDDTDHKSWDSHIQEIANAINHSCHSSTGETPYFINFCQYMAQNGKEYQESVEIWCKECEKR